MRACIRLAVKPFPPFKALEWKHIEGVSNISPSMLLDPAFVRPMDFTAQIDTAIGDTEIDVALNEAGRAQGAAWNWTVFQAIEQFTAWVRPELGVKQGLWGEVDFVLCPDLVVMAPHSIKSSIDTGGHRDDNDINVHWPHIIGTALWFYYSWHSQDLPIRVVLFPRTSMQELSSPRSAQVLHVTPWCVYRSQKMLMPADDRQALRLFASVVAQMFSHDWPPLPPTADELEALFAAEEQVMDGLGEDKNNPHAAMNRNLERARKAKNGSHKIRVPSEEEMATFMEGLAISRPEGLQGFVKNAEL
eukprot:gene6354-1133_t